MARSWFVPELLNFSILVLIRPASTGNSRLIIKSKYCPTIVTEANSKDVGWYSIFFATSATEWVREKTGNTIKASIICLTQSAIRVGIDVHYPVWYSISVEEVSGYKLQKTGEWSLEYWTVIEGTTSWEILKLTKKSLLRSFNRTVNSFSYLFFNPVFRYFIASTII